MHLSEWLVVLATLLSPLIAVQVSQWLDRRRREYDEKLQLFTTLMATRARVLDPRHVESLNKIDVIFYRETEVRRLWKAYFDFLCSQDYPTDTRESKRKEKLVELLAAMAIHLKFDFDKTDIKNATYYPEGHGEIELDQIIIRRAMAAILSGNAGFPVHITGVADGQKADK